MRIRRLCKQSGGNRFTNGRDPTIALFGVFGAGNLGNECTLQAMLENLRRLAPNLKVCCICAGPDETALVHHVSAFPIRQRPLPPTNNRLLRLIRRVSLGILMELYRWLAAFRLLTRNQLLIMTGTGMLSDVGIGPFGLHYDILRWSIVAKLCRCKVMFLSVGVGPIRHPLSRLFVKMALRMAEYRSYRDAFSKNYVEGMGLSLAGDAVYPDLAFSLPKDMLPRSRRLDGRRTVVGIGLITNDKRRATQETVEGIYHDYIMKIGAFVLWLIEHKYAVRFLVGDVIWDNRARQDVIAFLKASGVRYESEQVIDEPVGDVAGLLAQMAATDILVASRFHNVLLALLLRKPVVAISFHEKVDSLMDAMGLTQFRQDIEHVDVDKLIDQLTTLEQNSESTKRQLEHTAAVYRRALEEQYEDVLAAVKCDGLSPD